MALLSSGKLANLLRLADAGGRFKMLAIDQRDSLRSALGKAAGREPADITYEDMAATKALITEALAPYSTATLVDPVYGLPQAVKAIPGDVAMLVAAEETGYERAGTGNRERKSRLVQGWSIAKAKRAGANAVKLLVYYNPDVSSEVLSFQQRLVERVGKGCAEEDLPFLLELVTYPSEETSGDTPEFAKKRPRHTIESAREFSKGQYYVDILKLEFPGDLKYSREFHLGVFDGRERAPVYSLEEIQGYCREVDAAAQRPWVILSGGVDIREFLTNLELAIDAGASGFLCGRAIWKDAVPRYPDLGAMRAFLTSEGAYNFVRANAVAERARPWFAHLPFVRWEDVRVADDGQEWYQRYQER
ncbi:MAG TPA: tagatose 1,6-diphosphate aldolase [bacterium]|nr:tagatose 1,6-diphosphate aldolase [bacterium]